MRKNYFARPLFSTATQLALLALLLPLLPLQAQYTFITNRGKITITGYTGPGGNVRIPCQLNGRPVTGIGDGAFYNLSQLTNVSVPSSVLTIGFAAFAGCENLTQATLGRGVTNLSRDVFRDCPSLRSINVNPCNAKFSSVQGILFNKPKTTLQQFPAGLGGHLTVPDSVTNIADNAAFQCPRLTAVTFGTNVTHIGQLAFAHCPNLARVNLPPRLADIGWEAFRASGLTNLTLPDSVTNLGGFAFAGCTELRQASLGNGLKAINKSTFENCAQLAQLTFGQSLISIGDFAFAGSGLTNLTIPDGVRSIAAFAFNRCAHLTHVTLPNTLTNLGDGIGVTFARCTRLTSITIGSGVTDLGDATFLNCASLTDVYFLGNAPAHGADVFTGAANATLYYLPGTTGWDTTFAGQPTALWQPQLRLSNGDVAARGFNPSFGFDIHWANGTTVVVEACTDLANPLWVPLSTNVLTGGSAHFSDPDAANLPARIYRAALLRTDP